MKIEIRLKVKGKERISIYAVDELDRTMKKLRYKITSFKEYRICDKCELQLPSKYPKYLELCPNCESGEQQARHTDWRTKEGDKMKELRKKIERFNAHIEFLHIAYQEALKRMGYLASFKGFRWKD